MQGRGGFCITDKNSKTGMNFSFVPVLPVPVYKKKRTDAFGTESVLKGSVLGQIFNNKNFTLCGP